MIADRILASMASSLTTFVANLLLAEISKQRAVKDDVSRLKKNYERVQLLIKSAESRVMLDDEVAMYWMKRIKDHMYDVETIVDHWNIKKERSRQHDAEREKGYHKWPLRCPNCSLKTFADAIKALNEDFEAILKLPAETETDEQIVRSYGKTAPDYNADITGDYVGEDARIIIKLLNDSTTKCHLIAIVGMAGIGKTSLARMVYHTVEVATGNSQDFETKLWIRFSKDLRKLIMWSDCREEGLTKDQLLKLGTEIANKKFLLVVDDVWTENVWETLLEGPLQQGKPQSSMIVTTRNEHVAKRIGATHIHRVKRMNNIDAWRLLCQRASLSQNDEEDLMDIGHEIVKKCDGLPLAIRSIGRTLRGQEPTRHDWENACRTAFQDLSPEERYMINLSFQDLSFYMRQCFLYCSIFPEGFFIEEQYIIQQWISEGFILEKRKFTLEEVAEGCFYELIGRGLLHLEFGNDGVAGAKMPVIVRSFAKDVSDYENFCSESISTALNLFEVRRLSIVANNKANIHNDDDDNGNRGTDWENAIEEILDSNKPSNEWNSKFRNNTNSCGSKTTGAVVENNDSIYWNESTNNAKGGESARLHGLKSMKCLRTLILRKSTMQDGIRGDTLKQLKFLRVLDFREAKGIEALPGTIGNLEYLRYLNISETNISIVPGTIVNLRMLQYLLLRNCKGVHRLPKGIQRLRNLRCLDMAGTGITDINWKFRDMEELISIRGFPMKRNGFLLSLDLENPGKLAILRIERLENVLLDPNENSLPIKKYQLKELELCYNADRIIERNEGLEKIQEVLNRFRPNKSLVHLKIENYLGTQYPSWILMLSNLQRLHLRKCVWCEELPSLGQLPQLKFLAVTDFGMLRSLGVELRGNVQARVAFPRLQQLHIGDMPRLHRWSDLQGHDMPQIQILRLSRCKRLVAIPLILQESKTLMRLEIDTITEIAVGEKLQHFAKGIVLNVENTWRQPLESFDIATPKDQPPQGDEVTEETMTSETYVCETIQRSLEDAWHAKVLAFGRKKAAIFVVAALAIPIVFHLLMRS